MFIYIRRAVTTDRVGMVCCFWPLARLGSLLDILDECQSQSHRHRKHDSSKITVAAATMPHGARGRTLRRSRVLSAIVGHPLARVASWSGERCCPPQSGLGRATCGLRCTLR